jgi:hypothetical protein
VLLLTLVALWPIWSVRFLPMQDYPQHLFLSHVIESYGDPALDWKQHYDVDLKPRPYVLWYALMAPLAAAVGVEAAGKLTLSLYVLLIAALALASARGRRSPPWGALLLFPFAFNQTYFMGFSNYLLSMPVLFLAILDLEALSTTAVSLARMARHAGYLAVLFLDHPYTLLVYAGLTACLALASSRDRARSRRILTASVGVSLVLGAWYLTQGEPPVASVAWAILWWPPQSTLAYYLLMFTGMRWTTAPDLFTAVVWLGVAALFALSWLRRRDAVEAPLWPLVCFASSLLGFLLLPFWLGYYSYFNLRLAPVTYFALALLLARVRLAWRAGALVGVLAALLLVPSIRLQLRVSREVDQVLPWLARMPTNALILPLVFDGSSAALDPYFFQQFHAHEADYYHVIVGGGANPTLFPNAMMPVQYRPEWRPPFPAKPWQFSWPLHGGAYDYFVTRGAPPEFVAYLRTQSELVIESGPWALLRNPNRSRPGGIERGGESQ